MIPLGRTFVFQKYKFTIMGGIQSSLARKYTMALSGLFLVLFLLQHFTINLLSVVSPDTFNEVSHFMGFNFFVQAILQPILIAGVIIHFVMGFILEIRNNKARNINYVKYDGGSNSSWMSRNMFWSGLVILAFLGLHFYDFWFPELIHKYIETNPMDPTRFYPETVAKFAGNPIRTGLYVISFIFLMMHLLHGFASSFQTMGVKNQYNKGVEGYKSSGSKWVAGLTTAFAIVIPLGFIFIALFHFFNN